MTLVFCLFLVTLSVYISQVDECELLVFKKGNLNNITKKTEKETKKKRNKQAKEQQSIIIQRQNYVSCLFSGTRCKYTQEKQDDERNEKPESTAVFIFKIDVRFLR